MAYHGTAGSPDSALVVREMAAHGCLTCLHDHGAADQSGCESDRQHVFSRARISERNGPHVLADERVPFRALAEPAFRPEAKNLRCLTGPPPTNSCSHGENDE